MEYKWTRTFTQQGMQGRVKQINVREMDRDRDYFINAHGKLIRHSSKDVQVQDQ